MSAGASDFLTKPFSTTELHVRIKNLVESHQYQRKVSKQNQVLESTIEQLKETETQLVQTEKLASLGRMSAGIIHEINNPLNFATTGLFTLRNKGKYLAPEQQEEYEEILKDVEEGIKRVKNIVSDLRMFTHPDTESRDQVEVAEVVGAALRFLSNEWKDKVRIEQKLAEHQTVWANKNKLIHVLVNLLQNSLDALQDQDVRERAADDLDRRPPGNGQEHPGGPGQRHRALTRSIWTRFSTRFSPPRTWAKAWGWAWPSATASCGNATAESPCGPKPASFASLRWNFRRKDNHRRNHKSNALCRICTTIKGLRSSTWTTKRSP